MTKLYRPFIFIAVILSVICAPVLADSLKPMDISLDHTIRQVMKNNFDISLSRINAQIAKENKIIAESEFDSTFSASLSNTQSKSPSTSTLSDSDTSQTTTEHAEISIIGKSVFGSTYSVGIEAAKTDPDSTLTTLDPLYSTSLKAEITKPLLKGMGRNISLWRVRIAGNNESMSLQNLRAKMSDIILKTEETFWEFVYSVENLKVQNEFLDRARDLERRVRVQVDVGSLPPIEIVQAQASVASREEDVLAAHNRIDEMSDELLKLINPSYSSPIWINGVRPLDEPSPSVRKYSLEENVAKALSKRPEILVAKSEAENKNIELIYYKNQQLPQLDLIASLKLNGIRGDAVSADYPRFDGEFGDSLSDATSGDYYDYSLGFKFVYPFANRGPKSAKVKADLEVKSALIKLRSLERDVTMQTRAAMRQIEYSKKQIQAVKVARKLSEKKLAAEVRKFEVGSSTSFNVLEFQKDLATAKSREVRALMEYRKSIAQLGRAVGGLLESWGYSFEGESADLSK